MKLITAIIQPDKLDEVREALLASDVSRITVSRVTGHGQQEEEEIYRGKIVVPDLIPKVRIEIAVNEEFVKPTVQAILATAKHGDGEIGDGKVFVTNLEECIRIRTEETGGDAI